MELIKKKNREEYLLSKLFNFKKFKLSLEKKNKKEIFQKYFLEKKFEEILEKLNKMLKNQNLFIDNNIDKEERKIIYFLNELGLVENIKKEVKDIKKKKNLELNYWLILEE